MATIGLKKATSMDKATVIAFDRRLDKNESIKRNREEKISKAISNQECFIILADKKEVGFMIFDYRFFDQGWIELMVIDEEYRGKGIARSAFDLIAEHCTSEKLFTSTNRSNIHMQKALAKAQFTFAGVLEGLDDGDPELFFYRRIS